MKPESKVIVEKIHHPRTVEQRFSDDGKIWWEIETPAHVELKVIGFEPEVRPKS